MSPARVGRRAAQSPACDVRPESRQLAVRVGAPPRAGASGFLLKDAPESQLIAAIAIVAGGGSIFAPHATRRVIEAFARLRSVPAVGLDDLTPREVEVLGLIARGQSNREIAASLGVSEHTAKTHVAHILDKLELRGRVQAIVLAYEAGIVRPGDDGLGSS